MNGTTSDSVWRTTVDPATKKPYYYNSETKATVWIKPDELLTPAQLATGWTETSIDGGRPYWFDKADKTKTAWEAPPGWNAPEPQQFVSSSLQFPPQRDQPSRDQRPRDDYYRERPSYDRRDDGGGYRGPVASTPGGVEYKSQAEAEAAFTKLLTKTGVQPDWSWEKTMRATIQDPTFRALKEPTERKDAFEKFQEDQKVQEKERQKERALKLRTDFRTMLSRHPEVKHYTRWRTARPILEDESIFRSTDDEEERKRLFREYITELRQNHGEKTYRDHEDAMKSLAGLLREVNLSPDTKWEDAHKRLQSHPDFVSDEKYKTLTKSEVLDTFVAQIRRMWDDVNTIKQREKTLQFRKQRKAREGFLDLLRELQDDERLKPTSTWKAIHSIVEDDPRYQALLDNVKTGDEITDGSTPQDLFFDTLEEFERELYEVRTQVELTMKDARFKFTPKTSLDEFLDIVTRDDRIAYFKKSRLEAVYKKLQQHALDHQEDIARDEKRQQKKAIDALRSKIKRLDPPVELEDTWEQVRTRIERYDEYNALPSEEDRRAAYEKHMSRLEDDERDRTRRHDRERVRDDRHSSRRERRRSRTPARELDPYEADRRRAVEQRERQYRHTSHGGLSPPPRERKSKDQRFERDDRDRRDRQSSITRYERERRERDAERERAYISRADPYAKAGELDYGESSDGASRPVSSHGGKRAGSETGSRRSAKRPRTERNGAGEQRSAHNGDSENPAVAATDPQEEAPALQSGSEEGEIEEV